MSEFTKGNIINNVIRLAPLIVLFIAVLNEFDLNYLEIFSLNFSYILIFYWSLRKTEIFGYGYIFTAGLINDVVVGLPIGISSFNYLLICGFAAYLRTITLKPVMEQSVETTAESIPPETPTTKVSIPLFSA